MIGPALDRTFRAASGRTIGALAARFRDLDLAEEAFAEACARAVERWSSEGLPSNPAGWLYRTAERAALDALRRTGTRAAFAELQVDFIQPTSEELDLIADERLRLIFICCHPAIAAEARAALTLRLVCGLSTLEIARAFLLSEATFAQRLVRAKRKIAEAGIPFEVPGPAQWPDRIDSVLTTLEVAYAKAHEDAAGAGHHAYYAAEILELTRTVCELLPDEIDALALAALVRFAEARRPARTAPDGAMVPLAEQDPSLWRSELIAEGRDYIGRALRYGRRSARLFQAAIHGEWCNRRSLAEPPPWRVILALYDGLLELRDDPVVRLNRTVAVAEVAGIEEALTELDRLRGDRLDDFLPYHALAADLLRRAGRPAAARDAYERALALNPAPAEAQWLKRQKAELGRSLPEAGKQL